MYNIFTKQTATDNFFVIDTIEPSIGSTVQATAENMMEILRAFLRQPGVVLTQAVAGSSAKVPVVKAVFNGIELIAKAGWSSAESIVEEYIAESNRRAEEYKNSPEGKEAEKNRQQEIKALEIKRDELMVQLETLDWDNLEAVIDWLCEMQ